MKENSSKNSVAIRSLVMCALFTALGLIFPQIFHLFGAVAGQTFLPMHIPVLIAGLCVSPLCGAVAGVLSPMLSCFITQMPSLVKMPFMCLELLAYGLFAGLFMKLFEKQFKSRLVSIYISLICAQIVGRAVNFACTAAAVYIFGINNPAISVNAAIMSIPAGLVGLAIQWIFIPPVVAGIKRYTAD